MADVDRGWRRNRRPSRRSSRGCGAGWSRRGRWSARRARSVAADRRRRSRSRPAAAGRRTSGAGSCAGTASSVGRLTSPSARRSVPRARPCRSVLVDGDRLAQLGPMRWAGIEAGGRVLGNVGDEPPAGVAQALAASSGGRRRRRSRTLPPLISRPRRANPSRATATVLLPEPDSPTRPIVSVRRRRRRRRSTIGSPGGDRSRTDEVAHLDVRAAHRRALGRFVVDTPGAARRRLGVVGATVSDHRRVGSPVRAGGEAGAGDRIGEHVGADGERGEQDRGREHAPEFGADADPVFVDHHAPVGGRAAGCRGRGSRGRRRG